MNKSTFFSGQPVFAQLINLIPKSLISSLVRRHSTDRYYKKFKTYDHLITMLYACFHQCTSLREVVTGLEASYNKFPHLKLTTIPRRSTLAEANTKRTAAFFESLYHELYRDFYGFSPVSRRKESVESRLFIMDSTTISLYSDVIKGAGCPQANGRKKGGVKAHVLLNASYDLPELIYLTEGAQNDRVFMKHIRLPKGAILVFDRGYHHYAQWDKWTKEGVNWITRLIGTETFEVLSDMPIDEKQQKLGIQKDQRILLGGTTSRKTKQIIARLITYYDHQTQQTFCFLTNNFRFKAPTIADLYYRRWNIEVFFKRFKQNNPVKYFLGDNENAIKVQIWCAFIKDLLIKIIKDRLTRKWSFANLSAMIHHHLMNYIDLKRFLNHPDRIFEQFFRKKSDNQGLLFPK